MHVVLPELDRCCLATGQLAHCRLAAGLLSRELAHFPCILAVGHLSHCRLAAGQRASLGRGATRDSAMDPVLLFGRSL
jgi:hypothetical protein